MLDALLKTLHLLGVIAWVGGMFFSHACLRPSLVVLEPPQRLALMHAVLGRFFAVVIVASLVVLATGLAMAARAGFVLPPDVWAMLVLGVAMLLIFGWIRLVLFARFTAALRAGPPPEAAKRLAPIRQWVLVNLVLGVLIVIVVGLL